MSFWKRVASWFSEKKTDAATPQARRSIHVGGAMVEVPTREEMHQQLVDLRNGRSAPAAAPKTASERTREQIADLQERLATVQDHRQAVSDLFANARTGLIQMEAMHTQMLADGLSTDSPEYAAIREALEKCREYPQEMDRQMTALDQEIAEITRLIDELVATKTPDWPDLSAVPRKEPPPPGDADTR